MSLPGWIDTAVNHACDHLRRNESLIREKLSGRQSFETWLTALLSEAFDQHADILAIPEIGYCTFKPQSTVEDPSRWSADLLIVNWPNRELVICEAAIVLFNTQTKWKEKIARDYYKLSCIQNPGVTKLLLVYSCSDCENVVGVEAWDNWFASIPLRNGNLLPSENACVTFPVAQGGQFALKVWLVP